MTGNNSKSGLDYLDELVDEYNNSYHLPIGKSLLMQIILLWLKKLRQILKHLNLKLVIGSGQLSIRIFLAKVTPIIGQEK